MRTTVRIPMLVGRGAARIISATTASPTPLMILWLPILTGTAPTGTPSSSAWLPASTLLTSTSSSAASRRIRPNVAAEAPVPNTYCTTRPSIWTAIWTACPSLWMAPSAAGPSLGMAPSAAGLGGEIADITAAGAAVTLPAATGADGIGIGAGK